MRTLAACVTGNPGAATRQGLHSSPRAAPPPPRETPHYSPAPISSRSILQWPEGLSWEAFTSFSHSKFSSGCPAPRGVKFKLLARAPGASRDPQLFSSPPSRQPALAPTASFQGCFLAHEPTWLLPASGPLHLLSQLALHTAEPSLPSAFSSNLHSSERAFCLTLPGSQQFCHSTPILFFSSIALTVS